MTYQIPQYKCRLVRDGALERPYVSSFNQAKEILFELLADLPHEEIHALFLDGCNQIVGSVCVSQGGLHGAAINASDVFRPAIVAGASGIILSHNHPSGDPTPSVSDLLLTKKLIQAGELLGIQLLDHIIVCPETRRSSSVVDALDGK